MPRLYRDFLSATASEWNHFYTEWSPGPNESNVVKNVVFCCRSCSEITLQTWHLHGIDAFKFICTNDVIEYLRHYDAMFSTWAFPWLCHFCYTTFWCNYSNKTHLFSTNWLRTYYSFTLYENDTVCLLLLCANGEKILPYKRHFDLFVWNSPNALVRKLRHWRPFARQNSPVCSRESQTGQKGT